MKLVVNLKEYTAFFFQIKTKNDLNTLGKSFYTKNSLGKHKHSHTDDRPFSCEQCGKQFKAKHLLKTHIHNTHMLILPYECDICGKKAPTKTLLKEHRQIHDNIPRYECLVCQDRPKFNTIAKYRHHQRKHKDGKIKEIGEKITENDNDDDDDDEDDEDDGDDEIDDDDSKNVEENLESIIKLEPETNEEQETKILTPKNDSEVKINKVKFNFQKIT